MLAITAFQKEVKSHNITPPPRCGLEFSNANIIPLKKLLAGAFSYVYLVFFMLVLEGKITSPFGSDVSHLKSG